MPILADDDDDDDDDDVEAAAEHAKIEVRGGCDERSTASSVSSSGKSSGSSGPSAPAFTGSGPHMGMQDTERKSTRKH